jgi:hypothetical protein
MPKYIILLFLVYGCSSAGERISEEQIAEKFRIAVNQDDVTSLTKLVGKPLSVFEQEWESAQDGTGFVLGARKSVQIDSAQDVERFMADFVLRLKIEGDKAVLVPQQEYSNFSEEFADTVNQWRNLKVYLFMRGEGDVEHIVLIGLHPESKKIHAIYIN